MWGIQTLNLSRYHLPINLPQLLMFLRVINRQRGVRVLFPSHLFPFRLNLLHRSEFIRRPALVPQSTLIPVLRPSLVELNMSGLL